MVRDHDEATGEFTQTVSKNVVLQVLNDLATPVGTITQISNKLDCSNESVRLKLQELVDDEKVRRMDVGASAVVWYPANQRQRTETSTTLGSAVLFSNRREIVVNRSQEKTVRKLSRFAHLIDSNRSGAAIYRIQKEDIWQSPYESFDQLLSDVRDVFPEQSPQLNEWIERQWDRAHQFTLQTHPNKFSVLEAEDTGLMTDVAREKLDQSHLYRHLSDSQSRVVSGSEGEVKQILYDAGYPVQDIRDLDHGADLEISLQLELREYQREWVGHFLERGSGVFVGPSGSGKTVAAMGAIEAIGGETLVLVPSRELATQWRSELIDNTTIIPNQIGEYHGGQKEIRPITIATYHTAGMDRHRELFDERQWGLIVYDEVHHIPASIYRQSANLQAKHRLGLSATPVREDDKQKEIFTLIGPPIGSDWKAIFGKDYVQEPDVEIRYVPWHSDQQRSQYQQAEGHQKLQLASQNSAKLDQIQKILQNHADEKTLIFVEWIEQGDAYEEKLGYTFVSGETSHGRRDELFEQFRQGVRETLIISRIGDEGIDLPDAEVAIVASGLGGSRRQGAQRAGRTMRPAGESKMYMLATRSTTEEDFAQHQMKHLVEKGVPVQEVDVS